MSCWQYFSDHELACRHCGQCRMHPLMMEKLVRVRQAYGRPMIVSSAYRCPEHNAAVSSTGLTGPHTTGRAVDIVVYGEHAVELLYIALVNGFKGIGVQQKGPHAKRFLHLDDIRARMWSYS